MRPVDGHGVLRRSIGWPRRELDGRPTKEVIEAFLASAKDALVRGEDTEIGGFGTFKVRHR